MNFKLSKTLVAAVTVLTSLAATAGLAGAQIRPTLEPIKPRLEINPGLFPPLIVFSSISGNITNSGSNNGGQPDFACQDIEVYIAEAIPAPPPPPGELGLSIPNYKKIGQSVKATGNIQVSCQYNLSVPTSATGKPIYVFATSPQKWTTSVNVVYISPTGWNNPVQVNKGEHLKNKNMRITATLIK
ncbi:MAG: hypothetical protein KME08_07065 [Aphanothece sp. CMT-3BRIN-NPC111]|jgi:hypothetical protein|nr:hypothetical protein [Aphanothece sp. CMT-3BRIN-NPC111]